MTDEATRRRRPRGLVVAAGGLVLVLLVVSVVLVVRDRRRAGGVLDGVAPATAVHVAKARLGSRRYGAALTLASGRDPTVRVSQVGTVDAAAQQSDVVVEGGAIGRFRAVVDGGTLYVRSSRPTGGGKAWGRLPVDQAGTLASGVGGVGHRGLASSLLDLLPGLPTPTRLGVELVDGQKVRHYRVQVPVDGLGPLAPAFVGVEGRAGVDVFLAPDGAPRRITVAARADAASVLVALNLRGVGTTAPVVVPSPADVADLAPRDLAALLRG